jgi:hypothetical protein
VEGTLVVGGGVATLTPTKGLVKFKRSMRLLRCWSAYTIIISSSGEKKGIYTYDMSWLPAASTALEAAFLCLF